MHISQKDILRVHGQGRRRNKVGSGAWRMISRKTRDSYLLQRTPAANYVTRLEYGGFMNLTQEFLEAHA